MLDQPGRPASSTLADACAGRSGRITDTGGCGTITDACACSHRLAPAGSLAVSAGEIARLQTNAWTPIRKPAADLRAGWASDATETEFSRGLRNTPPKRHAASCEMAQPDYP